MKTHTDIDVVRSWSFEKQMGWVYALNELEGKDKEVVTNMSTKFADTSAAFPKPEVKSPPSTLKRSAMSGGKVFTKAADGTVKSQLI